MNPTPIALRVEGVEHRYGRRIGLRSVTFAAEAPGVVAIRGANGAGKSTLLRIVAGLLRPSQGHTVLSVGDRDVATSRRFRHVGFASPELSFYPEFSVRENLRFAAEARGDARPDDGVRTALEEVGLTPRAADPVGALSSGMLQRLRLAFAMLHDPALVLLDEPANHLDDHGRDAFEAWLSRARRGRLIVIATNDEREWRLADRSIALHGRGLGGPA